MSVLNSGMGSSLTSNAIPYIAEDFGITSESLKVLPMSTFLIGIILPSTRWLDRVLMVISNRLCFRYRLIVPIQNRYRLMKYSQRSHSMGSPERRTRPKIHHHRQLRPFHFIHHVVCFGTELGSISGFSTSIWGFCKFSHRCCPGYSG